MKKIIIIPFVIILIGLIVIGALCMHNQEPQGAKELNPVLSFGNQRQVTGPFDYSLQEGWIYSWEINNPPSQLVKFQPEKPEKKQVIYTKSGDASVAFITALNGWVYFVDMPEEGGDYRFCSVKEGGNRASCIGKADHYDGLPYVLTEDAIVYQDMGYICVMDLNGRNKERVLYKNNPNDVKCWYNLAGLDGGWIYYTKYVDTLSDSDTTLYRIKPGEMKEEMVLDLTNILNYVVDQKQTFFIRLDNINDAESKGDLIQKSINGEEKVLVGSIGCRCLNKVGDWLYFGDDNKVYKINVKTEGKKQLVYDFKEHGSIVLDIFLDGNDILIETQTETIYINQDGTAIDLTERGV